MSLSRFAHATCGLLIVSCTAEIGGHDTTGIAAEPIPPRPSPCSADETDVLTLPFVPQGLEWMPGDDATSLTSGISLRALHHNMFIRIVYQDPAGAAIAGGERDVVLSSHRDTQVMPPTTLGPVASATLCADPSGDHGAHTFVASVNIGLVLDGDTVAWASYSGAPDAWFEPEVALPLIQKNNGSWQSVIAVHNPNLEALSPILVLEDREVVLDELPGGGTRLVDPRSLAAIAGPIASATVRSSDDLSPVAAALLQSNGASLLAYRGLYGIDSGADLLFPLVNANNSGYQTGVQIYNPGESDTTVTLSYAPGNAGTAQSETQLIPARAGRTFALQHFASSGERFVGSARVTGNSAGVALRGLANQLQSETGQSDTYIAGSALRASSTIVMPLIAGGSQTTGITIMNTESVSTTVTCAFAPRHDGNVQDEHIVVRDLGPYESYSVITDFLEGSYIGSGHCRSHNGVGLLGTVNQLTNIVGTDGFLVHEALPDPEPVAPSPNDFGLAVPLQPNSGSSECALTRYEPDFWNVGGTQQANTNCYSYASNTLTNGIGMPGKGGGLPTPGYYVSAEEFFSAIEADGFVRTTELARCPNNETKIAAVWTLQGSPPGSWWHFARLDRDGYWSEVPVAGSTARRLGLDGFPMTDIAWEYRHPLFELGFFCGCSGADPGQGLENVIGASGP